MDENIKKPPVMIRPQRPPQKPGPEAMKAATSAPKVEVSKNLTADAPPAQEGYGLPDKAEHMAKSGVQRKPFGAMEQKLYWPEIPGWHLHWFNDVGGRIMDADKSGYVHILDRDGKKVERIVGTHPNKPGGLTAYLMAIPIEWYDESMVAERTQLDQFERDLRRGAVEGTPGEDGRYVPEDSTGKSRISIKDERVP